ncbi:L-rhamnose mutarotase [Brevibacterium rongguiense]|nr:L-rhamnose mutarotase [Brevibacterium rongguiense]
MRQAAEQRPPVGQPRERICFQMQVDPESLDEYIEAHAAVWPDMLRALAAAGWTNYSLFARPDGMIIGYVETDDYTTAQDRMSATEINAQWQAHMSRLFAAGGSFDTGQVRLAEIFHLEDQLANLG